MYMLIQYTNNADYYHSLQWGGAYRGHQDDLYVYTIEREVPNRQMYDVSELIKCRQMMSKMTKLSDFHRITQHRDCGHSA